MPINLLTSGRPAVTVEARGLQAKRTNGTTAASVEAVQLAAEALSDSARYANRPLSDAATADDALQITVGKVLQDTSNASDAAPVFAVGKGITDSTISSDSGFLRMTDYADITYFEADFVGSSRTF